jgi:DNA-binding CsgD family transcriptional regulator/tetratricopeptide (TPR) repeat protein
VILATVAILRGGDGVRDGVRALEQADWDAARAAFESALDSADAVDQPEAHEGLGLALWMLGRIPEGISERERAYDGYVAARRCDDAARVAVWVSHQHLVGGRASAARGWLARAERSVEASAPSAAGRGWVAVERARHAESVEEQITQAQRAVEIARTWGDGDLEVFALSLLGRAVVSAGRREDGLRLLEEAMAAASSGRARNVHTLAEAYCNLIEGCASAGEWERGNEWCELVSEFALTHKTEPLFGSCRTVHANVLLATGQWPQAEDALEAAVAIHARNVPQMSAPAVAALAELRVLRGRLLDAERLLRGREEEPASLRALALLRLAEGRPQEAAALLQRGLLGTTDNPVRAAALLAPLVDARLECGDPDGAGVAAGELSAMAASTSIRLVSAYADLATARVALAVGRRSDAAEPARRALTSFSRLAMPFGAGQARLELARALVDEAPGLANDEARTAYATFRELGATRAMDNAARLLRDLGGGTGPGRSTAGDLTAREHEVLELIALGMSNSRIGATLSISEKTAGHHVSRILAKLGVRNRAEAAAHAVRPPSTPSR